MLLCRVFFRLSVLERSKKRPGKYRLGHFPHITNNSESDSDGQMQKEVLSQG